MKVLVTGARGLLGAAITREFEAAHEVLALDRGALDVTDAGAVERVVSDARPGLVVNCAAYNNVDAAEDAPETALDVNAFAVLQHEEVAALEEAEPGAADAGIATARSMARAKMRANLMAASVPARLRLRIRKNHE